MTPEEHVHHAVDQYPVLTEVLQVLDANLRAAALHAIILTVQEAQHAERRECARIALEYPLPASDGVCQALVEAIASEILAREPER